MDPKTVVLRACEKGNLDDLKESTLSLSELSEIYDRESLGLLHIVSTKGRAKTFHDFAVRDGYRGEYFKIAEYLVSIGFDVNKRCDKQTPLHLACKSEYYDMAELLLDHNADVNLMYKTYDVQYSMVQNEYDALYHAIHSCTGHKSLRLTKLLLSHGANPNRKYGHHTEVLLATSKTIGIIKALVSHGANVNAKGGLSGEVSVLTNKVHQAGNFEVVKYLVSQGAVCLKYANSWKSIKKSMDFVREQRPVQKSEYRERLSGILNGKCCGIEVSWYIEEQLFSSIRY